jgi:predicted naringenin-chalcone synthase
MTVAHVQAIGTAVPPHQVHDAFVAYVRSTLKPKQARLFDRMVGRAGIERRFSFIEPEVLPDGRITDTQRFYGFDEWPSTGARMEAYARYAPKLAMQAIAALGAAFEPEAITHVVVASCTGFTAPGLDQQIIAASGIPASAERTVVGFMGCYAAVNALRLAHHIVRSEPAARVLVVNLELCTLHFQRSDDMERLLAMLLFGDGATAAVVSSEPTGVALGDFRSAAIPGSSEAITWHIRDQGFDMHLDGQVPALIGTALATERLRNDSGGLLRGTAPEDYDCWAVHAGGRTILDAVEGALGLADDALEPSRRVLREHGNMSSATLMFVLRDMLAARAGGEPGQRGMALAFGPGLAVESFRFELV